MKTKEWLIEKRKELNLTQKDLANAIGTSIFAISNIEQGQRRGSENTWNKIEEYFKENKDSNMNQKKERTLQFKVDLDIDEAIELKTFLKEHEITNIEFVRESFKKLKNEFKQKEEK